MALAPALRRRPALETLSLESNPLGDEGLAALVAPPPAAGAPPPPTGGLANIKWLSLGDTQITDAGCAALAAAFSSGALPTLKKLDLRCIPASDEAKAAVYEARAGLGGGADSDLDDGSEVDDEEDEDGSDLDDEVEDEEEEDDEGS